MPFLTGINIGHAAVKKSDVIVLAVKPFQAVELLKTIKKDISTDKILISVVTGVTLEEIETAIDKKISLFRAMFFLGSSEMPSIKVPHQI